jgi:hypothetical protein
LNICKAKDQKTEKEKEKEEAKARWQRSEDSAACWITLHIKNERVRKAHMSCLCRTCHWYYNKIDDNCFPDTSCDLRCVYLLIGHVGLVNMISCLTHSKCGLRVTLSLFAVFHLNPCLCVVVEIMFIDFDGIAIHQPIFCTYTLLISCNHK